MAIGSNLLTTTEVADKLKVTPGRVRQLVVDKRLRVIKRIGINLLFDPKEVAAFARIPRHRGIHLRADANGQKKKRRRP